MSRTFHIYLIHFIHHSRTNLHRTSRDDYFDKYIRVEIWVLVMRCMQYFSNIKVLILTQKRFRTIEIIPQFGQDRIHCKYTFIRQKKQVVDCRCKDYIAQFPNLNFVQTIKRQHLMFIFRCGVNVNRIQRKIELSRVRIIQYSHFELTVPNIETYSQWSTWLPASLVSLNPKQGSSTALPNLYYIHHLHL